MKPVLVIHGGAGSRALRGKAHKTFLASLQDVLDKTYPILEKGGSALDTVIRAVELLEDDPLYNAGKGSKIQRDGKIRMSASIMDGHARRFSGCVNVEGVKNPVRLAELLLGEDDRVLAGAGAKKFAKQHGLKFGSPYTDAVREAYMKKLNGKTGTVGAVALDRKGRLAAATSTGGRGFEVPHRVSDSPTVSGNFANRRAAVSATGVGEEINEYAVAASICSLVEHGMSLDRAVNAIIKPARSKGAWFGFIALDDKGKFKAVTATETLIWASCSNQGMSFFKESPR